MPEREKHVNAQTRQALNTAQTCFYARSDAAVPFGTGLALSNTRNGCKLGNMEVQEFMKFVNEKMVRALTTGAPAAIAAEFKPT